MKKINVALLGFGTVGSGLYNILIHQHDKILEEMGYDIKIQSIFVRDITKYSKEIQSLCTTSIETILEDDTIDIIVEVMGTIEFAKDIIQSAFTHGKHVVSANKDLIALFGDELSQTAVQNKCDFYYEAAVAGGIPILQNINQCFAFDDITEIVGILNGTSNYILSKMAEDSVSYETALYDAQKIGFAEANPHDDVEGIDAARKIAILARLSYLMPFSLHDVSIKGISSISREDIITAENYNYTIKLICTLKKVNKKITLQVIPTFVSNTHPLSKINNEYNGIQIYSESAKMIMLSGPGAGSLPTANAVLGDLIAVIKNIDAQNTGKNTIVSKYEKYSIDDDIVSSKYFLQISLLDKKGVLSDLTTLFAKNDISLLNINQSISVDGYCKAVIITHKTTNYHIKNLLADLQLNQKMSLYSSFPILEVQ